MRMLAIIILLALSACQGGPQESDREVPQRMPELY